MFKHFMRFELGYALKQPMVYIFLSIITLLTFAATASDNVVIGGSVGNVLKNSPHIITTYSTILTIFGLLMATAFFNNAALREYNSNFQEILFSTPIRKSHFYFGRFFAALLLTTIPLLGIFIGSSLGSIISPAMNWVAAERFGPIPWQTFINNYLLFILPNMFIAGAIIFALANKYKKTAISFVGALIVIVLYLISGTLISDMSQDTLAGLTDIFGIRTYSIYTKYYTPIEKNTLIPSYSGLLLYNRLIWISIGFIILLVSYFSFSFTNRLKKVKAKIKELVVQNIAPTRPIADVTFSNKTYWIQFKSLFYSNFLSITKSTTFKILFLLSATILFANLYGGFEYFGLKSYPVTYKIIDLIQEATVIYIVIILVFFSGELVWREKDSNIFEVIDATPHHSITALAAKTLALISVASLLHLFFIFCGITYQFLQGFTDVEPLVYAMDFLLSGFALYFIWSSLMIALQVLLNHKYIAYFVSIIVIFLWSILMLILNVETNMLTIGGRPDIMYSDMNAFGPGLTGAIWFNLYWILFSLLLLFVASVLWKRGSAQKFKTRLQFAKTNLSLSKKLSLLTVGLFWIFTSGFVYYNTQILNPYKTSKESDEIAVQYENKFKKYENIALPKLKDVKYAIDIHPDERSVTLKAELKYVNEHSHPIDSIHFSLQEEWQTEISIPNAKLVLSDLDLGYEIYKLEQPLQPNSALDVTIETEYITRGFKNDRGNINIIKNGTFLNNRQILPYMGYSEDAAIADNNKRKKHGLPVKDRVPELEIECAHNCARNYLSVGRSDFVTIETIISTSQDQIAIAPGSLIKHWKENERNYYHYKVDHPSLNFYSFISAKYEVATAQWNDIDIEVYYDKKHNQNVDRMIQAVKNSLEYYTENFGPYYHKQCRIVEFPRYSSFAQAFAGTMPYSESIGFIVNLEEETGNNIVDAVIAHEMAHQWWAHQVIGSNMQGGTMMSESFAEYSSLMVMKHQVKDPMKMRDFLKYNHDRYLKGRSRETDKEVPLNRVENQPYIHYGKGSIVLYALQDYIGEEKVNIAMKNFLNQYKYQGPPYPSSNDFMIHLAEQVPDSLQYLIADWFNEITLYDNRVTNATYSEKGDGDYEVQITVKAKKLKADSIGNETNVSIDDWIDIGLFADEDETKILQERRVKIDQPEMTFTFVTDSLPVKAAIDPKRLLIDRVYSDNSKSVSAE